MTAKWATRLSPLDREPVAFRLDPPLARFETVVLVVGRDAFGPVVSVYPSVSIDGAWSPAPGRPVETVSCPTVGQALVALGYNIAEAAPGADDPPARPDLPDPPVSLRLAALERLAERHERALAALFDRAGMTLQARLAPPPSAPALSALEWFEAAFALRVRAGQLADAVEEDDRHRDALLRKVRELRALADRVDPGARKNEEPR